MAEKILNTRFQLKYDTWEKWMENDPVLKKGEVAFVEVPVDAKIDETNKVVPQQPVILMKVGDGEKPFSQLDWTAAKAADVHDWAKADEKPGYTADEIEGINEYIKEYVETDMGISVDTDTQYTIVPVEGNAYKYELKSKAKDATEFTVHVADIEIPKYDDTTLAGRIEAVENLVGTTSVQAQIAAYVEALKLGDTYATKESVEDLTGRVDTLETDKQDKIAWQSDNYDKDTNKAITKSDLDAAVAGLTGAMHFKGTEEALPEGEDLDKYTAGDVILVGNKEYVLGEDGGWHELGDEGIYAVKGNIKNADIAEDAAIAQSKIAGLTDALGTLNDKAHEHENKDVLDGIDENKVTAWDNAEQNAKDYTNEKIQELDSNVAATDEEDGQVYVLTGVTQEDGKLTGKTETKLAKIAKTGNVNDLVQTEGDVLVLYSGTSSTVM